MKYRPPRPARKICISPRPLPKGRLSRAYGGMPVHLVGGPLSEQRVWLHNTPDTLPIVVRGRAGQYKSGQWIAS